MRIRLALLLAVALCLVQAERVAAQYSSNTALPSNLGSLAGTGGSRGSVDPGIVVKDSYVGFIDAAVPRNLGGLRLDVTYNNPQPMRAEYLFSKGGLPNSVGFPLPETRVDTIEFSTVAEYSWTPWFSVFVEGPYRWINPEVNDNRSGAGDMRYGMKLVTWSANKTIATILCRLYQPTARHQTLGTNHWSIEPGLLLAYRFNPQILFEGELRYWQPLGGTDFEGNVLRYGAGVSYQFRKGAWSFTPVAEAIGWSVLSGKTLVATAADSYEVLDAYGQTIANGYLGLRIGYNSKLSFYAGYGRSFTGDFWQREIYRFELRYVF